MKKTTATILLLFSLSAIASAGQSIGMQRRAIYPAGGGGATPTFSQGCGFNNDGNSDTSVSCTLANTATGDFVYACVANGGTNQPTGVTVGGATMTPYGTVNETVNNQQMSLYYLANITGSTTPAVVATWAAAESFQRLSAGVWTNVHATPADGHTERGQNGTGTPSSGAITPTANGDLIISCIDNDHQSNPGTATLTAGSGFTRRATSAESTANIQYLEDQVQATATSIDGTWTTSDTSTFIVSIAAFKHN